MSKLAEKRLALLNEAKDILDLAEHTGTFTNEDKEHVEALHAEAETLEAALKLRGNLTPAPLLADGGGKAEYFRSYRDSVSGVEVRSYTAKQAMPTRGGGVRPSLEETGDALVTMLTGRAIRNDNAALRAMSEGVNTAGGLLVSEELSSVVIDASRAQSRVLAAGAQSIPMQSDSLRLARITEDPEIEITGEGASLPFNDASFDSILIVPKKFGVVVGVSNELLADAPNAGQVLVQSLTQAVSAKIDDLLLNGDGAAFTGLLGMSSISETGSIGSLNYDDLLAAQYAVRALNGEPSACILHPRAEYALSLLRDQVTGSYLAPPASLASMNRWDSTRCPEANLILGDFSKLLVAMRQSLLISISDTAGDSFKTDSTYIRATFRMGSAVSQPHFHRLAGISY